MATQDRVRWDTIYRDRAERPLPPPAPLLLEYSPPVIVPDNPPRALDFACGLGQNGLWLAEQGYVVDLMDISRVALNRAQAEMVKRKLRAVNLLQIDADTVRLDESAYDLISIFRFLHRDLIPQFNAAVKPGGRIIYETFNLQHLDANPDFNVDYLVQGDELKDAFKGWRILVHHHLDNVTQLVAIKPRK